jgi:cytochrome c biogenesis protein CcmG, thiol:disulfide interchange protein DsbE
MKKQGMNKAVLIGGLLLTAPLIVLFGVSFGKDPYHIDSPLVGRVAPPFELTPVSGGSPISIDSLRGKPVVLNFWATWCGPCQQEHGVLQQASRIFGERVRFIGVVYDDEAARINDFLAQHGSGYPALVDRGGKAAIAYGVSGVPETFFIDSRGQIVSKYEGPLDPNSLVARLEPILEAR